MRVQRSGFRVQSAGILDPESESPGNRRPQFPRPQPSCRRSSSTPAATLARSVLALSPSSLGGWLFSYAAATVITGMAILGAWVYKVSHDCRIATVRNSRGLTAPGRASCSGDVTPAEEPSLSAGSRARPIAAGPIPKTAPRSAAVPLGRKYALASGLMEITYQTRGQGHPPRARAPMKWIPPPAASSRWAN